MLRVESSVWNVVRPLIVSVAIAGGAVILSTTSASATAAFPVVDAQPNDRPGAVSVSENRADAETCLAQAISYEAGREPEQGQEAVAQVVLNRLHRPGYPKTVCGVVFQGSARRTGCQFTFTCDGSLARRRPGDSWTNALRIARLALDGQLVSPVGDATHYHAYYVTPAWSAQLTRVGRIGAHIFYGGAIQGSAVVAARLAAARSGFAGHGPAVPQSTVFSAWGLQTAMLIPTAGSIKVQAITGPAAALDHAIPPRAPDTAGPPIR